MMEYHFKKLTRTIVVCLFLLMSGVMAAAAPFMIETDPAMAVAFLTSSVLFLIAGWGATTDGYVRRALNTVLPSEVQSIERPDSEVGQ
jgi:hypothetical protein